MTAPASSASERIVTWASRMLEKRVGRRGLLMRATFAGTAVTTVGWDYILRPGTAYAWVCGDGASCYSGWTAMCCTINSGVNQCPPGSFAGGWWKAEGANLCGGTARYYVDCQAECHCGCHGSSFCSEGCWNCRPHCADGGGCDRRRVCHTVFRYGQCNRHRGCSGPVLCRAISCTPPWQWAECTTTAATSQATVDHSAPCLPGWSAISERYTRLGSQGSVLGATVHAEEVVPHGRMQRYTHGRMYYSASSGAHFLTGPVLACYLGLAETASPLRLPITDSGPIRDDFGARIGVGASFEQGAIYQQPGRGAFALWGEISLRYEASGGVRGALGFPTSNLAVTADGAGQFLVFERGSIYQQAGAPAYLLPELFAAKYNDFGRETGVLGFPVGEAREVSDTTGTVGRVLDFASGAITVRGGIACAVWGPVYAAWIAQGGVTGALGYPLSDVHPGASGGDEGDFDHGTITVDPTTGATTTTLG